MTLLCINNYFILWHTQRCNSWFNTSIKYILFLEWLASKLLPFISSIIEIVYKFNGDKNMCMLYWYSVSQNDWLRPTKLTLGSHQYLAETLVLSLRRSRHIIVTSANVGVFWTFHKIDHRELMPDINKT